MNAENKKRILRRSLRILKPNIRCIPECTETTDTVKKVVSVPMVKPKVLKNVSVKPTSVKINIVKNSGHCIALI